LYNRHVWKKADQMHKLQQVHCKRLCAAVLTSWCGPLLPAVPMSVTVTLASVPPPRTSDVFTCRDSSKGCCHDGGVIQNICCISCTHCRPKYHHQPPYLDCIAGHNSNLPHCRLSCRPTFEEPQKRELEAAAAQLTSNLYRLGFLGSAAADAEPDPSSGPGNSTLAVAPSPSSLANQAPATVSVDSSGLHGDNISNLDISSTCAEGWHY
jgi:hypothetical protein